MLTDKAVFSAMCSEPKSVGNIKALIGRARYGGSKLCLDCESLGEHTLKNIDEPACVYRVRVDSSTRGEAPPGSTIAEAGPGLERG
jgi:hypothetical protein